MYRYRLWTFCYHFLQLLPFLFLWWFLQVYLQIEEGIPASEKVALMYSHLDGHFLFAVFALGIFLSMEYMLYIIDCHVCDYLFGEELDDYIANTRVEDNDL